MMVSLGRVQTRLTKLMSRLEKGQAELWEEVCDIRIKSSKSTLKLRLKHLLSDLEGDNWGSVPYLQRQLKELGEDDAKTASIES